MIMKTILLISFYYIGITLAQYNNLDNLGERISQQVQHSLRPLNNLGAQISNNVNSQLSSLDHLGEQIQQQVYQGLKPVRILESILKVKQGSGGTTIATYSPSGKQLIIRDGNLYECTGTISESNGVSCSGNSNKLKFDKNEDYCFTSSRSIVNNQYCISSTGSIRVSYINGKIECSSNDGSPTLLISDQDYKNLCKNVASSVHYKYFTNNNLQEFGDGLECSGNNPQICNYSEKQPNSGSNYIYSSSGGVFISNKK